MRDALLSPDTLRARFARRLQDLYRAEVPAYARLHDLVLRVNEAVLRERGDARADDPDQLAALSAQRHGAIRVGSARELALLGRLFGLFGMHPVDFYDLVPAGLPVMSTAFRPTTPAGLATSPFRMFCSLLRPELIPDRDLRAMIESSLREREIFPAALVAAMERAEAAGGVAEADAERFVNLAIDVFRWTGRARLSRAAYESLASAHRLVADIVAFPGPHINHLTPSVLDIDRLQGAMEQEGFNAKAVVEGPPRRACPILLRQTACTAAPEDVAFPEADGSTAPGAHTARFGEVEERGVALTGRGRELYDACLAEVADVDPGESYKQALEAAFARFPDTVDELIAGELAYFRFSVPGDDASRDFSDLDLATSADRAKAVRSGAVVAEPVVYEDFLPVSAAGIFRSNLGDARDESLAGASSQATFEEALGRSVLSSQVLYAQEQEQSVAALSAAESVNGRPR